MPDGLTVLGALSAADFAALGAPAAMLPANSAGYGDAAPRGLVAFVWVEDPDRLAELEYLILVTAPVLSAPGVNARRLQEALEAGLSQGVTPRSESDT